MRGANDASARAAMRCSAMAKNGGWVMPDVADAMAGAPHIRPENTYPTVRENNLRDHAIGPLALGQPLQLTQGAVHVKVAKPIATKAESQFHWNG